MERPHARPEYLVRAEGNICDQKQHRGELFRMELVLIEY